MLTARAAALYTSDGPHVGTFWWVTFLTILYLITQAKYKIMAIIERMLQCEVAIHALTSDRIKRSGYCLLKTIQQIRKWKQKAIEVTHVANMAK